MEQEIKPRIYPMREQVINIMLDEIRHYMAGANGMGNADRLTTALHSLKELIPPDKFEAKPDIIHHRSVTHFKFWDRIKILFGKPLTITSLIYTMEECHVIKSSAETFIPKFYYRSPKVSTNDGMQVINQSLNIKEGGKKF